MYKYSTQCGIHVQSCTKYKIKMYHDAMGKHWKISGFLKPVSKFTKMLYPPKNSRKDFCCSSRRFSILNCLVIALNARFHLSSSLTAIKSRRKVMWTVMRTTADRNGWWYRERAFWSCYADGLYWHFKIIKMHRSADLLKLLLKSTIWRKFLAKSFDPHNPFTHLLPPPPICRKCMETSENYRRIIWQFDTIGRERIQQVICSVKNYYYTLSVLSIFFSDNTVNFPFFFCTLVLIASLNI